MTRFKLLAATAILSTAIATPVLAQAVVQEPGAFAFYHPNGDLGLGSRRPAADAMASDTPGSSSNMARFRSATMSHPLPAKHVQSVKTN
jgi:hypothetical protein